MNWFLDLSIVSLRGSLGRTTSNFWFQTIKLVNHTTFGSWGSGFDRALVLINFHRSLRGCITTWVNLRSIKARNLEFRSTSFKIRCANPNTTQVRAAAAPGPMPPSPKSPSPAISPIKLLMEIVCGSYEDKQTQSMYYKEHFCKFRR